MDSHRDRFHEANILLSNTLKQLDEVMGKGSMQDLPTIMSSSAHGRLNGNLMAEDFKNGNPKSAFTIVDQMSNSRHGDLNANHGIETSLRISRTISTPDQRVSDPSSTWEENANKDTNSIDSMAESSTGESPLSDAQSSSNESTTFTMDKLLKAIEMDKLPAPNSQARYKILKWVYENDGNECLASILVSLFFCKDCFCLASENTRNVTRTLKVCVVCVKV
ncbi:hypothetical protein M3Y97_00886200 [Aphelenchoides bicaudatus]|nr:hypothetical protein M3Y97_00886200 [Aphelenchoides bicaudatus]